MIPIPSILQFLVPGDLNTTTWLAVTIALVCILCYARGKSPALPRLAAALAKGLAFAGLALLAYLAMNGGYQSFSRVYSSFTNGGSLSNLAWTPWHKLYGEPVTQHDLVVTQYVTTSSLLKIDPMSPGDKDQYMTIQDEKQLEQNSITAFTGHVTMNLVNPQHQADSYNAYALTALYEYEIANPSGQSTHAKFRFPLDSASRVFRDVHIRKNGEELNDWQLTDGGITWDYSMQPGQVDKIAIQYVTWGTNGYVFQVDQAREVTRFQLSLALETDNH